MTLAVPMDVIEGNFFLIENKVRKTLPRNTYDDFGIVLNAINLSVTHTAVFCIPNNAH